tara:strand:- start:910 stop:1893 length:984 start_codon:yes stop_codon:yes gene_type:complete
MKNITIIFSLILAFSCGDKTSLDYQVNQLEKLFEKRKNQKEKEISDIKKYKYLAEEKYLGCDCTDSELEEDYELYRYLSELKEMSNDEIATYMNCGIRIISDMGRLVVDYAVHEIGDFISIQYDKYGFNPYELSDEQAELLAKDTKFQRIFPYKIKGFGQYYNLTSDIFTYEMFKGFTNPEGPVRIIQPLGISEPLSQDVINEYNYVLEQIVEDYIFEEDVHYYIICPSRYESENDRFNEYGDNNAEPAVCVDNYEAPPVEGVDTDGDGLSDEYESFWDTDPQLADTDGDGFNDGDEVNKWFSDPMDGTSFPLDEEIYFFVNCEEKP